MVVLSNNDSCVIARSNEAKALGIDMGAPWHLQREQFSRAGVIVRSSNYALYGDMSGRVVGEYSGHPIAPVEQRLLSSCPQCLIRINLL